jgi:hypothetical protein
MPTVISELTGEPVDTSSEAWRHECECAWLLANKPNRAAKHLYLYGVPDRSQLVTYDSKTGRDVIVEEFQNRRSSAVPASIYKARGLEAADRILEDAKRLHQARISTPAGRPPTKEDDERTD